MSSNKCKECGCTCNRCVSNQDVHLHLEIENLKQRLVERENHIVNIETMFFNEENKFPNGEFFALREELLTWQDKYSRLYESHKRVQKVNQSLEDKLLKLVDKTETEKSTLTKDVATLSHRLADANFTINRLQEDNEKYKNDVNLAIQLLQCKPTNFVSHRIDSLPNEVQAKVSSYVASKRKPPEDKKPSSELRSIKVPIPTFPPTAMVYSIPKSSSPEKETIDRIESEKPQVDIVSAAIMAKILEDREKERSFTKHCDTCTCSKNITLQMHSVSTQTIEKLACAVRSNSMKIVKTGEGTVPNSNHNHKVAVSENSKISLNTFSDSFTRSNVDHHRLCDQNTQRIKGPRYCSMRLQSGSKNILLDNIHGSYAPVLYTRQDSNERKLKKESNHNSRANSTTSSDERKSSSVSEADSLDKQRVAEWVQNINEGDNASRFDTQQYAQIESNVKSFLLKNEMVKKPLAADGPLIDFKCNNNLPAETQI